MFVCVWEGVFICIKPKVLEVGGVVGSPGGPRAAVDMLDEDREEPGCLTPQACLTHWAGNGLSIHGGRIILRLSSTKYSHMHGSS